MGKITINYDLYEEILNSRERFSGFKILRADRKRYLIEFPIFLVMDCFFYHNMGDITRLLAEQYFITIMLLRYFPQKLYVKMKGIDLYKEYADMNLIKLIPSLNNINVSTNYELLLNSQLDSKNYEISKDTDGKSVLVENKYIMIPTHNPMFNNEGETQMTSIHQEHIIGTNEYALSVGLNQKNKQKILSLSTVTAKR